MDALTQDQRTGEPRTDSAEDSQLVVTLKLGDIRRIIRDEVAASGRNHPLTDTSDCGQQLLTAKELATALKVPVSWVYEQSRVGNIPTVRVGRYLRFRLEEVLAVVQSQKERN